MNTRKRLKAIALICVLALTPVTVTSCYKLSQDAKAKIALLNWVECGGVTVLDIPVSAYSVVP